MSAGLLREAAALMRDRAEAATPSPWTRLSSQSRYIETGDDIAIDEADDGPDGHTALAISTMQDPRAWRYADVEHIASWHPAVALAVADWLEQVAGWDHVDALMRPAFVGQTANTAKQALTVARAYLGRDA